MTSPPTQITIASTWIARYAVVRGGREGEEEDRAAKEERAACEHRVDAEPAKGGAAGSGASLLRFMAR